jgi:hypothetical protein
MDRPDRPIDQLTTNQRHSLVTARSVYWRTDRTAISYFITVYIYIYIYIYVVALLRRSTLQVRSGIISVGQSVPTSLSLSPFPSPAAAKHRWHLRRWRGTTCNLWRYDRGTHQYLTMGCMDGRGTDRPTDGRTDDRRTTHYEIYVQTKINDSIKHTEERIAFGCV